MNIRPRTTGEIFDDAWRLYLADAPVLLALSTLFLLPAALALLLLLALPAPAHWAAQLLLPGVTALLVPLTGLGSAACQEAFRLRAEGAPIRWRACLRAVRRHGLDHMAGRTLIASAVVFSLLLLRLPMLIVSEPLAAALSTVEPVLGFFAAFLSWALVLELLTFFAAVSGAWSLHPIIAAGERRFLGAWRSAMQEAQRQAGKAAALALARPPLWALAALNLHLLVRAGLWVGDDLAGFDWALPAAVLTLANPTYGAVLILLSGLLLAPFFEAANYLLHVDARARYEGLDLWYRVRQLFPAAAALVLLGVLTAPASAADGGPRAAVGAARQVVATVRAEVHAADPYPGGQRWLPRLRAAGGTLARDPARLRWFDQAVTDFAAAAERPQALAILADLDRRLLLLEDTLAPAAGNGKSRQEIKALLPEQAAPAAGQGEQAAEKKEPRRPVRREEVMDDGPAARRGGRGIVAPAPDGGLGRLGWLFLLGLLIAAVAVAVVKGWQRGPRTPRPPTVTTAAAPSLETLLAGGDRAVGEGLWRQADELAQAGRWLDALRTLYLAVLALLHRADVIRYAQTRTNREYLDQVRRRGAVYPPFEGLTEVFELKWYGEKSCQAADYQDCRQLAEQVREGIRPR